VACADSFALVGPSPNEQPATPSARAKAIFNTGAENFASRFSIRDSRQSIEIYPSLFRALLRGDFHAYIAPCRLAVSIGVRLFDHNGIATDRFDFTIVVADRRTDLDDVAQSRAVFD